jgi:hypothetical protein
MSITLTTGTLVQINGSTVENDTIGACISMHVDYFAQTVTFVFRTGVIASGNLNAGNYGPTITLTVVLATGAWTSFNSSTGASLSGTIGAGALANFVAQLKSDRNLVETFAAGASGILPGTQVSW